MWLLHGSGSDSQPLTSLPREFALAMGSLNEALAQVGECFLLPLGPPATLPELLDMPTDRQAPRTGRASIPRDLRVERVLDTAARLFYARGIHAVGMDELITSTGLAKMKVHHLFPTKDDLVGAYLARLAARNLGRSLSQRCEPWP